MNLNTHTPPSEAEKLRFYEVAAKRFKAELRLYGATAAIHIENKNDEVFWGKILRKAYPEGKFRFISASRSASGNMTCGCTQCLQYRPFLDRQFWIAIDSDYRYLSEEPDIDVQHFILQTYTYSFENHFCYAPNVNRAVLDACGEQKFDFVSFLENYSRVIYPLLVWQMYLQSIDPEAFPKNVFHRLLTLPIGARSIDNNGASVIQLLKDRTRKLITHLKQTYPEADTTWYEARCNTLGVRRNNAYLYVRGHQLYDLIAAQGRKLRSAAHHEGNEVPDEHGFEYHLTSALIFDEYDEINKIVADIDYLRRLNLPKPQPDAAEIKKTDA